MKIPKDKVLHFFAGIVTAAVMYPFGSLAMLVTTSIVAIAKEVVDYNGYGTPDINDAIATICGGYTLVLWYTLMI